MKFQDNLREYREKAGYKTAKDFSEAIEIPYSRYLNYENKGQEPKYDALVKIASALGITTDELLGTKQDYTRYFVQAGYDVEKKEGVLYFSSRWQVTEDKAPHSFSMDRLEYESIVKALDDNHKRNIVDVVSGIVTAREVKEDFKPI